MEPLGQTVHEARSIEILDTVDQTVRWQDDEPGILHGEESHHAVREGLDADRLPAFLRALPLEIQRRLKPVVPVGNKQFSVCQEVCEFVIDLGLRDSPDTMPLAEIIFDLNDGAHISNGMIHNLHSPVLGIGEEHENQLVIGLDLLQQPKSIRFWPGEGSFMGSHLAFLKSNQCDEALARMLTTFRLEKLIIRINAGFRIRPNYPVRQPFAKEPPGFRVVCGGLADLLLGFDNTGNVVRAACVVLILERGADFVIGLGDDRRQISYNGWVKAMRSKGGDVGHRCLLEVARVSIAANGRGPASETNRKNQF